MRVIIGSDNEGREMMKIIRKYLESLNLSVLDVTSYEETDCVTGSVRVAKEVLSDNDSLGIFIDGYGVGSFMAATKVKGMVVAEVSDERTAYMTREHNNARMITLGAKIVGEELATNIVRDFLNGKYAAGRHQIRVDMSNKMA